MQGIYKSIIWQRLIAAMVAFKQEVIEQYSSFKTREGFAHPQYTHCHMLVGTEFRHACSLCDISVSDILPLFTYLCSTARPSVLLCWPRRALPPQYLEPTATECAQQGAQTETRSVCSGIWWFHSSLQRWKAVLVEWAVLWMHTCYPAWACKGLNTLCKRIDYSPMHASWEGVKGNTL